ncbi:MarR family transcriptional regulator [Deinococcus peraridilitoris]|uniref:HTH marR-type domain-containing protein n=1 Tax=Deinococcus peraridilitoris (strain DSM 19664 / LMG 22246 / CIP 109416 / KR-200) TaxID=937777 RepID=L0A2W3_DEIPD|nr:MarR family transcriptional regulator [Deinococcus peraridilitoris]AFZ68171.1 hypothetical protein Deipe_2706 [Deinococcus peraridilitoris DSM 19664]
MTEAQFGPLVHEALEYALLSRACAHGCSAQALYGVVPGGRDALLAAVAVGYLVRRGDLYFLTRQGEDRLDVLFLRLHAQPDGDLTMRVLRLLSAIGPLTSEQIAQALGASSSATQRVAQELAADGYLIRTVVRIGASRGRGRHLYALAA